MTSLIERLKPWGIVFSSAIAFGLVVAIGKSSFSPEKWAGICIVCFVGLFVVIKPFWGLCLLAFFLPLQNVFTLSQGTTILKLMGAAVLLGWVINVSIRRETRLWFPNSVRYAFLFVLWGLLSYFWAAFSGPMLTYAISLSLMVGLLFIVPQLVTNTKRLHLVILSNALGAVISAAFGLHAFAIGVSPRIAAFSEFGQKLSVYGLSLSIGIFYFLSIAVSKGNRIRRSLAGAVALAILVAGLASNTRTFMVGIAAAFAFALVYFLKEKKLRRSASKLVMIVALIAAVLIAVMPGYFFYRVHSIYTLPNEGAGRLGIWKTFSILIYEHPLLGVGLANGAYYYGYYLHRAGTVYGINISNKWARLSAPGGIDGAGVKDEHNIYIQVWADLGIVGFGLLLAILLSLGRLLYRSFKKVEVYTLEWRLGFAITLEFIFLIVMGVAEPILLRNYFWIGLSLILGFARVVNKQRTQNTAISVRQ